MPSCHTTLPYHRSSFSPKMDQCMYRQEVMGDRQKLRSCNFLSLCLPLSSVCTQVISFSSSNIFSHFSALCLHLNLKSQRSHSNVQCPRTQCFHLTKEYTIRTLYRIYFPVCRELQGDNLFSPYPPHPHHTRPHPRPICPHLRTFSPVMPTSIHQHAFGVDSILSS